MTSGVAINETNFPDDAFRAYVSENFDADDDGILSSEEIRKCYSISVDDMDISTLKGIEYFTRMYKLSCNGNALTSLDMSHNPAREIMYCEDNRLTSLDVSGCTALIYLSCDNNQLTSLDVSGCTALTVLSCIKNRLTELDIRSNDYLLEAYRSGTRVEREGGIVLFYKDPYYFYIDLTVRIIDGSAKRSLSEPTAEPTPELAAEPTPEPTPEPTAEPTPRLPLSQAYHLPAFRARKTGAALAAPAG